MTDTYRHMIDKYWLNQKAPPASINFCRFLQNSSPRVVPVLGWHHFQFEGKRQNPVSLNCPLRLDYPFDFAGGCLQGGICSQCAFQGIYQSWAQRRPGGVAKLFTLSEKFITDTFRYLDMICWSKRQIKKKSAKWIMILGDLGNFQLLHPDHLYGCPLRQVHLCVCIQHCYNKILLILFDWCIIHGQWTGCSPRFVLTSTLLFFCFVFF